MAAEGEHGHSLPQWFVPPGEVDTFGWLALALLFLGLYGVVTLYAAFDRWAEHRSKGTPLSKTIPTLLAIALLYEIFPLEHFSLLLPLTAILIALMMDWSRYAFGRERGEDAHGDSDAHGKPDPDGESIPVAQGTPEANRNV
ncbi:MAG: hypothetical protein AAF409_01395 [Pseudomonadota bacterium]